MFRELVGETYPGQHAAIVDDVLWTAAQDRLAQNAAGRRLATNANAPSLLAGLVHDETGDRLCPTHACKKGRRHRYCINAVMITVRIALRRRGVEAKLVIADSGKTQGQTDPQLCRLVARARLCFDQLASGEIPSVRIMAEHNGSHESDISRTLPLAFLAPDIVEAILDGRQPVELTAESLKRLRTLPTDWDAQSRLLGFSG